MMGLSLSSFSSHFNGVLSLWKRIQSCLFPSICVVCQRIPIQSNTGYLICNECSQFLNQEILTGPFCRVCGVGMDLFGGQDRDQSVCPHCQSIQPMWNWSFCGFCYKGIIRELIIRFKYHGEVALLPILSSYLLQAWKVRGKFPQADLICPIPIHRWRLWLRGYNQTELLAEFLGYALKLPVVHLLERCWWTPPQTKLPKKKRIINPQKSMKINTNRKEKIWNKRILLVDDVMTTGSTLMEATRILSQWGAREISIAYLARRTT